MEELRLKGQVRTQVGKGAAKKLRRQRLIPAVVYGGTSGPTAVTINPFEMMKLLGSGAGENVLISLAMDGENEQSRTVILKALQRDPVRGGPLHADFLEVSMQRKIKVQIPVRLVGEAIGVKLKGGLLEQHLREVSVECLPGAIPSHIQVDISHLDLGHGIHVRELTAGGDIKVLEDPARPVVTVLVQRVAAEGAAAVAEEKPTEPEVVGKKEAKEVKEGK
ncbi:MAG: 50S ribosomal protein L25 [Candidatus Methylomirabilis oxygeniifera]|uniref:Large ribosomal subunit protein bL25 n=1 Tax=Methylomirabilis oxygeniifera TaxID=671143 RepID=D5MK01_METO1|nr:MAG: 50S ribosomal protein L25 [Candidatus Methylomirabilis oxyfera]CBE67584.1 50S ribosomal protein L25 (General stress protein CTC) [Candidatus Methylomirabilis oxyfera]